MPTRRPHRLAALCLGLAAAGLAHAGEPGVLYVDDQGDAEGDGSSWATPLASLQDALDVAEASRGLYTEIRVGAGRYTPDVGTSQTLGARTATFLLRNGLTLRGGYAGTGAPDPDLRDPATHLTVLTGDLQNDDGAGFAGSGENAYHVVTIDRLADPTVLDGFVIRGGRADGPGDVFPPDAFDRGAAVAVYETTPILRNCVFEDNWSVDHGAVTAYGHTTLENCVFRNNHAAAFGAGLYVDVTGESVLTDCTFEGNDTPGEGGGVYNKGVTTLVMCTFIDNNAMRGGGVYSAPDSQLLVNGGLFEGNEGLFEGGGVFSDFAHATYLDVEFRGNRSPEGDGGGGVWNKGQAPVVDGCLFEGNDGLAGALYNIGACPTIRNCTFRNNVSVLTGAGVWNEGCVPVIESCHFENNVCVTGGGLYNDTSDPIVLDCTFIDNAAIGGDGGGAIANAFGSNAFISGCTFIGNRADNGLFGGGGAIVNYISSPIIRDCLFIDNEADLGGGAIYNELEGGRAAEFINCTFLGNVAGEGGGMMSFRAHPRVVGCVFTGNTVSGQGTSQGGGILNHYDASPTFINCTVTANAASDGAGMLNLYGGATIINSILWGNDGASLEGDPADVRYSLVEGGAPGEGNLDVDPRFVRLPSPGPDAMWGTDDDDPGDLGLAADSPAIDAGSTADLPLDFSDADDDGTTGEYLPVDRGGNPRITDGRTPDSGCGPGAIIDIGAYESAGIAIAFAAPGDLDDSGAVDASDLFTLLAAWGPCPDACCAADLDRSGAVDFGDLMRLLAAW